MKIKFKLCCAFKHYKNERSEFLKCRDEVRRRKCAAATGEIEEAALTLPELVQRTRLK